jgi:hypothetical protein
MRRKKAQPNAGLIHFKDSCAAIAGLRKFKLPAI